MILNILKWISFAFYLVLMILNLLIEKNLIVLVGVFLALFVYAVIDFKQHMTVKNSGIVILFVFQIVSQYALALYLFFDNNLYHRTKFIFFTMLINLVFYYIREYYTRKDSNQSGNKKQSN